MKKLLMTFLIVMIMLCVLKGKNSVQSAEQYPAKPISFIVPLDAGGGMDVSIRCMFDPNKEGFFSESPRNIALGTGYIGDSEA